MFICRDCGEGFKEPKIETYREEHEYWGAPAYETFVIYRCPYCGSDDVEETEACPVCGEAAEPGDAFCKNCHIDLARTLKHIQAEYRITYEELKDFIAEHFGW